VRVTQLLQAYSYLRPSAVHDSTAGRTLALETSGGATPAGEAANPRFFSGFLTAPGAAATALLAVADVAAARYYRPSANASLDPVVTADGDRLRLESFSGCCGVYARLDVLASGLDGDDVGHASRFFFHPGIPARCRSGKRSRMSLCAFARALPKSRISCC
jgi:hypothetical protein